MFALIERLRQWKQRYAALAVFVLDGLPGVAGVSRDEQMAQRVRAERVRRPQGIVLTLTGNAHNRLKPLGFAIQGRTIPAPDGRLAGRLVTRFRDVGDGWRQRMDVCAGMRGAGAGGGARCGAGDGTGLPLIACIGRVHGAMVAWRQHCIASRTRGA